MQLKTILNKVQKFKSFVYGQIRWIEDTKGPTIKIFKNPTFLVPAMPGWEDENNIRSSMLEQG